MSDYSDDGFDSPNQKPTRDGKSKAKSSVDPKQTDTSMQKNVRFKLGGTIDNFGDANKDLKKQTFDELPASFKKQSEKEELEHKKKFMTLDDIVSDSKSNKHVIYKFMKKGF